MICSGNTSNLFLTPARSRREPVMVFTSVMRSLDELRHVLVAGRDQHVDVLRRRLLRQRADHVVGFHARRCAAAADPSPRRSRAAAAAASASRRASACAAPCIARTDRRGTCARARRTRPRSARGDSSLQQLVQHVEHAEHGAGRLAVRVRQRRQRVERAIQIARSRRPGRACAARSSTARCEARPDRWAADRGRRDRAAPSATASGLRPAWSLLRRVGCGSAAGRGRYRSCVARPADTADLSGRRPQAVSDSERQRRRIASAGASRRVDSMAEVYAEPAGCQLRLSYSLDPA